MYYCPAESDCVSSLQCILIYKAGNMFHPCGKINHTTYCKPLNKNCLWRYTQLTHKSEWSVFLVALHKAIKKRLQVAFRGWPLNCTAYHCAVDSASDLLKTWYFLLNTYFLRHLKWTVVHWKWDELFLRVTLKWFRPEELYTETLYSDCELGHLNKNPLNTE